jgi:hypothetical protein
MIDDSFGTNERILFLRSARIIAYRWMRFQIRNEHNNIARAIEKPSSAPIIAKGGLRPRQ